MSSFCGLFFIALSLMFRISLSFWDDLAHVAYHHLEKGQQIHVSGRFASDSVEGDENKRQVYYKVGLES